VAGTYSETVSARLKEIGTDEALHAEKLRDRILALGGTPTMEAGFRTSLPRRPWNTTSPCRFDVVELLDALEAAFSVSIADEEAKSIRTVSDLEHPISTSLTRAAA
jgi:hypothetical protein